MSYAAIYEVTRALRMLLHSRLTGVSTSAVVTLLPPGDTLPEVSGVNLYLYRVVESPFARNQPWRGDRTRPPSDRPALSLQLLYLLTPLGKRPDASSTTLGDDAHTMLGVAMLTLHENPVLNDVHLPGFDADAVLPAFLRNSYEQVKITLAPSSLDELSKIWATINKPYHLSVAYEVSLVELTPTPPPPIGGGVVLTTGVNVVTLDAPRLASLTPAEGALVRFDGGGVLQSNDLQISGSGLLFPGQAPVVRVGGRPAAVKDQPPPTDRALTVTLPADLDAGPLADVEVTRTGRAGTPLSFTVSPWLARLTPIRTALPTVPANRKLMLAGSGLTTAPQAVRFDGPGGPVTVTTFDAGGSETQATITIPAALANGLYRVRVVLPGGAASNSRTLEVLPRLSRTVGVTTITVSGRPVHRLTLRGARLNGRDVRLVLDRVEYVLGPQNNPRQLVHTLGRLLEPGPHRVAVHVDGSTSRSVVVEV